MIKECRAELPPLDVENLIKRYKRPGAKERWRPTYQELLNDAERLAEPAVLCQEYALDEVDELHEWMPVQSSSVVLGVTTLGKTLDDHVNELNNTDMISAVILNEITLAMINAMTRSLHSAIRNETQTRGLKAGPAYRPGVGRWPLSTQEVVFRHIPAQDIGVSLDEYLLMRPIKSTSLIIPILDKRKDK